LAGALLGSVRCAGQSGRKLISCQAQHGCSALPRFVSSGNPCHPHQLAPQISGQPSVKAAGVTELLPARSADHWRHIGTDRFLDERSWLKRSPAVLSGLPIRHIRQSGNNVSRI
jgi:hypothetical protein